MLEVKIVIEDNDMFPLTVYSCRKCNHTHRFFSTSQKECVTCGEKFPNIRSIIEKPAYRIDHYNLKLGIENVNNTSGG